MKKQDKALIHAKRARNIQTVLRDPKDTAVESAQFRLVFSFLFILKMQAVVVTKIRFWVKKMFKLQTIGVGTTDVRFSSGLVVNTQI